MQTPESNHFITLDGIGSIHYVATGHGPPLVLLHGLGVSVVSWRYNISALSERYSVYALDQPGHGESDKPDITYDLETGVRFVLQFLDTLGLERVALVGNSMGGLVALALALRRPDRVQSLVLVDSPGLGRGLAWPIRLAALPGIGSLLDALDVRTGLRLAPRIFHHPERVDPAVHEELLRLRKLPEVRRAVLSTLRSGVSLLGLRPSLRLLHHSSVPLPVPTLVVWGQQDRIIPVKHARRVARHSPDVQVCVLPDCGHWPQMEQAQAFNEAVLAFLEDAVVVKEEHQGP